MNTRRTSIAVSLSLLSSLGVLADPPPAQQDKPPNNLMDLYLSTQTTWKMTPQEKKAIAIAEKWRADSAKHGVKPVAGPGGTIQFLYGSTQPSIVCAVLQVCDVELQPGEQVNSIHLGDTVRWTVEPAITGYGPTEVQHLIVKPMDVNLDTTLLVTTNRRTYSLRLRSHRTQFMPKVSFAYPDEALRKWDEIKLRDREERARATLPESQEYLGNLDFDYAIDGAGSWKPVRVYNDGVKTIIQMPRTLEQTEAPALLVVRGKDGFFPWGGKAEEILVNYRVQSDRYIVDTLFDKAILIAGVGPQQERVTITRGQ
jgi:P-type conjugative transfer protein TrbG